MTGADALRREILALIRPPQIGPGHILLRPDTQQPQTRQLQQAIDALSAAGGGVLELAAGCYCTGALHLKSGVELRLGSPDTLVQFIAGDPEEQYPVVFSHWEATPCYNYSALLYACDAADIAVTGSGVLDGGADASHWWDWHHQVEEAWSEDRPDLQAAARTALRRMNEEGVPVGQRVFGKGCWLRPNFVQFIRCERVLIRGVTFRNSPMWQLNPVQCRSVTVDGVTLSSHGPNNDGCDPESCQGVWIRNCRFDTGDDCISLKSGRDRDGREADLPCTDILIENNDFADGHGGIALGSEMSGGILRVLADNNRFSSPNLTYALRLKTNARRGGRVEQIVLRNSVMEHVHGAAVHGTMLYEDGRSGDFLPLFRDITVENIRASGGDYGIFLESFPEVPIRGLVLRNIVIDGVRRPLHGRNWQDAVVEQVVINGKSYPRPDGVRILGAPSPGAVVEARAYSCVADSPFLFQWECSSDGQHWTGCGTGPRLVTPSVQWLRLWAEHPPGCRVCSRPYRVLPARAEGAAARLYCRGMLPAPVLDHAQQPVTRAELARMLLPLADPDQTGPRPADCDETAACLASANGFLPLEGGRFCLEQTVTRQEMATVAMQACGINYRNASTTMPVCADVAEVPANYGTNIARALYFGFMSLDERGRFGPGQPVTRKDAAEILDRVADFAGL